MEPAAESTAPQLNPLSFLFQTLLGCAILCAVYVLQPCDAPYFTSRTGRSPIDHPLISAGNTTAGPSPFSTWTSATVSVSRAARAASSQSVSAFSTGSNSTSCTISRSSAVTPSLTAVATVTRSAAVTPPTTAAPSLPPPAPLSTYSSAAIASRWDHLLDSCPQRFQDYLAAYSAWHTMKLNELRTAATLQPTGSLPRPLPVIIYECRPGELECGGLGDRLAGVVLLFYLAMRLQALFFIDMSALSSGAIPTTFDWRYSNAAVTLARFSNARDANRLVSDRNCDSSASCMLGRAFEYNAEFLGNSSLRAMGNRGVWFHATHPAHLDRVRDIGLDASSWGCAYRALLRPSSALADVIEPDAESITSSPISVCSHLRVGDAVMRLGDKDEERPGESILRHLVCIREAIRVINETERGIVINAGGLKGWGGHVAPSDVLVFLASDSTYVKNHAVDLVGVPGVTVRSSNVSALHVDDNFMDQSTDRSRIDADAAERMRGTLQEWFTLGMCRVWSGTLASGYSRLAAAYSGSAYIYTSQEQFMDTARGRSVGCDGFYNVSRFFSYTGSSGARRLGTDMHMYRHGHV